MIKLLLVEDDVSLAYIEKTGLEDIIGGYEVVTATNGKEGLGCHHHLHFSPYLAKRCKGRLPTGHQQLREETIRTRRTRCTYSGADEDAKW